MVLEVVGGVERLLAAVDWSAVQAEDGVAAEFPQQVRNLWSSNPYDRYWAIDYLQSSGFCRFTVSEATVAMAPVVVALLSDVRLDGVSYRTLADRWVPVRAGLLESLAYAAEHAAWGGTDDELRGKAALLATGREEELVRPGNIASWIAATQAPFLLSLRADADDLLDVCLPWLDDPDPQVAQMAVSPVARFGIIASPAGRRTAADRLLALAEGHAGHQAVQGTAVLELIALDVDTTVLLDHPSLPIRALAALSPSTASDPRSLVALERAIGQAPESDDWLNPSPPLLDLRLIYQFAQTAAGRARAFEDLLPGAYAVAADGAGWEPLLPLAFPPGWRDRPLSQPQREFLRRIVDGDVNWHPTYTSWKDTLRSVGLPPDRAACRALAG